MKPSVDAEMASRILSYYFRSVYRKVGLQWDSDNDAEIEAVVSSIVEAAWAEARHELQKEKA